MTSIEFDLPGYDIIEKIGSGGMASVYRAKQHTFQRNVALKILRQDLGEDAMFCERFVQESLIVAKLNHSHIVQVYDVGEYKQWFYVAMEFLSKGNLSEAMENSYLSVDDALRVFSQILSALTYSHEKNIVHRDVKPDNIMFRDDGAAVLTDFGIAKDSDSAMDLTQTGTIMGTPKYMSPEQIRGLTVTPTSDLYSLGIMLFQMLTGSVPYTGATMIEVAYKHLNDPIPTLANELEKFQPLIDGLLAKESNQRIQNGNKAQQLLKDIQEATISTTSTTRTAPTTKDDATVILKKDTPSISTHEETALSHNAKSVDQNHSEKNPSNKIRKPVIVTACIALITAAAVILGTRYFKPDSAVTTADVSPSNPPTLFSGQENNPIELAPNEAQESTNNSTDQTSTETPSAADSLFRELQINGLLKSAEIDIQEGRLTSPKDNNALDKYQRVLVIDPSNVIAQQKIDELMP